jgi:anhydro-N-acetylmuramic acid kinase
MQIFRAIGLMSGTSCDGVDAAYIETDGEEIYNIGQGYTLKYPDSFRNDLRKLVFQKYTAKRDLVKEVENQLTIYHAMAVKELLKKSQKTYKDVDLIGFHGHTVDHSPECGKTWQIGNGRMLAQLTGNNVVYDFRRSDVSNGGQGAPLIPLYHRAVLDNTSIPTAILNIGGVANVTFIHKQNICAFDTGPGNSLIDDIVLEKFSMQFDENGQLASQGIINEKLLADLLGNLFFLRKPPKSLDRNQFSNFIQEILKREEYKDISNHDLLATISQFTVESVCLALDHMDKTPERWFICGGGCYNDFVINGLTKKLKVPVRPINDLKNDLNVDFIEAQGFGFLAARTRNGKPISLPSTTGIKTSSVTGGVFCPA